VPAMRRALADFGAFVGANRTEWSPASAIAPHSSYLRSIRPRRREVINRKTEPMTAR